MGMAALLVAVSGAMVRHEGVSRPEERLFRIVNNLPDGIYWPVWLVMQLGTAGAAPATAAVAWAKGDRRLATRLVVAGTVTWLVSKAVKNRVKRPRPAALLSGTRRRGPEPAGLGYLSGHAGVAVALGAAALPQFGRKGRAVGLVLIPVVGLARVYVGAHFPLDVVGGAALGLGVEALVLMGQRWADQV